MGIELGPDMAGFFRERLKVALTRQKVPVSEPTEMYLVHLLTDFVEVPATQNLCQPLVQLMADALEAPTPTERFRRFRELGDTALYVCGFFSDHLEHRGVSRSYVVAMGGRAYGQASHLAARSFGPGAVDEVYDELGDGFDQFARVLDEVRETTSLRTPQDIVRLYERWRKTGSPLLAARLEEEGVFPQRPPSGLLH